MFAISGPEVVPLTEFRLLMPTLKITFDGFSGCSYFFKMAVIFRKRAPGKHSIWILSDGVAEILARFESPITRTSLGTTGSVQLLLRPIWRLTAIGIGAAVVLGDTVRRRLSGGDCADGLTGDEGGLLGVTDSCRDKPIGLDVTGVIR
jgi:hypothetical protein